jgi:hypothetical protein
MEGMLKSETEFESLYPKVLRLEKNLDIHSYLVNNKHMRP